MVRTFLSFWFKAYKFRIKRKLFRLLARDAVGVVVSTEFGPVICDPLDNHVSRQLMKFGSYDQEEVGLYKAILGADSQVLIVGAHIGSVAMQLAPYVAGVVCVEANPFTYHLLQMNISLNKLEAKVSTLNFAVGSGRALIKFWCSGENTGGSKVRPACSAIGFSYDCPSEIEVSGSSLDQELGEHEFDFVLMDIEGSEFEAILGARTLLSRSSILVVEYVPQHITHVAGRTIQEFSDLLLDLNFDFVYFPRNRISGSTNELLLETMLMIESIGSYESGIIFSRRNLGF